MAKKLARHVDRNCTVIRFPSDKVPAALIPYLGLDETRPKAIEALVKQARSDADMTNAKCAYADTNPEAALICSLFDSAPPLTDPLVSRKSPGERCRSLKATNKRWNMFDCVDDVLAYHDDKVTLAQAERTEMRDRRDANRWSAGSRTPRSRRRAST